MKHHRAVVEFLAALAGSLVAIAAILTLRAWLAGAKDTDWLNFAGIIFGVALTIGGTKAVEALWEQARRRRRERDFNVAVRAIALCLAECAEAPTADFLFTRSMTLQSLWRVAAASIDQLPDLDFDHRAKIGIMQDGMDSMVPQLTSYALIATTTNPGLFEQAKDMASNAGLMVLPVTEILNDA